MVDLIPSQEVPCQSGKGTLGPSRTSPAEGLLFLARPPLTVLAAASFCWSPELAPDSGAGQGVFSALACATLWEFLGVLGPDSKPPLPPLLPTTPPNPNTSGAAGTDRNQEKFPGPFQLPKAGGGSLCVVGGGGGLLLKRRSQPGQRQKALGVKKGVW